MSKQSAPADLVESVARAAEEFGETAGEVDAAVAARLRVNGTDLRILGLVNRAGSMSAGELAVAAGLSPAATTTAVQRLVAGGHLVREVDPADRRRTVLTLTDSVLATIRESYGPVGEAGVELLAGYRPAELAVVERFLRAGIELQRTHAARIRALPAP